MHQRQEEETNTQIFIQWEEGCNTHKLAQVDHQATREIHENFGFVPNFTISTHLNAQHVLGKAPTGVYFTHFRNTQFLDLITKKSIPAAAATVLGLGLKFIPVPKKSIQQDDINIAIK
jgi:hypothetical protein